MTGKAFKAALFDLDGTLIASKEYWYAVVCDAAAHFGGGPVSRAAFDATFGQSSSADSAEFFEHAPVPEVDRFYNAALARHAGKIQAVPGAHEALEFLAARNIPTACVTNSTRAFTEHVLHVMRMPVSVIAAADEVARPKPAPDLVHLAVARLNVLAAQCCLIGDSRYDVEAGQAAGCVVVGLGVKGDVTLNAIADVRAWWGG